MNPESAIRYLASQAHTCRDRDSCEAFVLLLPAVMKTLDLKPMDDFEAAAFVYELKRKLKAGRENAK